jgi:hypothetical protein
MPATMPVTLQREPLTGSESRLQSDALVPAPTSVAEPLTRSLLADRLPLGSASDMLPDAEQAGADLDAASVPAPPAPSDLARLVLPIRSTPSSDAPDLTSGNAGPPPDALPDIVSPGGSAVTSGPVASPGTDADAATGTTPGASPTAATGGPAGQLGGNPAEIDVLAQRLYEPIARRLRAELRIDRERMGRLVDRPW